MIYILTIGHMRFAFPSNRGFQTVLETMAKARRISSDTRYGGGGIELDDEPVTVSMECVHGISFIKGKREVIEPEVMPRQSDESDAVFAMRCSRKPSAVATALALRAGSRRQVAAEMTRLIGEGK